MGRPGLTLHRKFKRLARSLDEGARPGCGALLGRGALELIWEGAYETGDPYLGDETDVEARALWCGTTGVLCAALRDAGGPGHAGFIEEGGTPWWTDGQLGTYRIHDLFDHAPRYVRIRVELEEKRRKTGRSISEIRAEAGRRGAAATNAKRVATGRQEDGRRAASERQGVATPAPAPAPNTVTSPSAPPLDAKDHIQDEAQLPDATDLPQLKELTSSSQAEVDLVIDLWNALAARRGLPMSLGRGKTRKTIGLRLRTAGWLDDFRAALLYIDGSEWHRGEIKASWKASLPWLLKNGKAEELAEKVAANPAVPEEEFGPPDEHGIRHPVASGVA